MYDFWFLILGLFLCVLSSVILAGKNAIEILTRVNIDETEYENKIKEKLYWLVDNISYNVLSLRIFSVQFFVLSVILVTLFFLNNFDYALAIFFSIFYNFLFGTLFIGVFPIYVGRFYPIKVSYLLRNILFFFSVLTKPIMLIGLKDKIGNSEIEMKANVVRDFREVVDSVNDIETFEEEDREIIESVFELGDTIVREIMVPRIDMVTVSPNNSIEQTLSLFVKSGYSRIPVVGNNMDDVYGVVYLKDILRRLHYHPDDRVETISTVMRPARFVPETIFSDNLLRKMQLELFHIAIVVDEYGGTAGLVTIEDLLEVLVGELTDEHDKEIVEPEEISPGIWKVPARFSINELDEILDIEIEDEDVDTVSGLLSKAIGKVPLPGASGSIYGINLVAQEAIGRRKQVGTILISKEEEI